MREYLEVTYGYDSQDFKLSETHLITKVLRDLSKDGMCTIFLKECTQKEYEIIFGKR